MGIRATPEFKSLLRKNPVAGQTKLNDIKRTLQLNRSQSQLFSPSLNEIKSINRTHALYQKSPKKATDGQFASSKKQQLSSAIKKFQTGEVTLNSFKDTLKQSGVKMNTKLTSLINQNERGSQVSFAKFGQEIFKQVEEREGINPGFVRSSS
tara:strand:+ start:433 stop:888 length:456 start_codon:yes stop_codon:yes gene_type:complete